jgi:DNA polymerase III subunit beta
MKLSIYREELLKPLQLVAGIAEKRQTLPILSNILLKVTSNKRLSITATDLEVQLIVNVELKDHPHASGEITVQGRKLMDICRTLPEHALIELSYEKNRVIIQSGDSHFSLISLPASDYPPMENSNSELEFTIEQKNLRFLLQRTCFAMAQQDVRYFLNGMLLEINQGLIRSVAADGHRLALNAVAASIINNTFAQVIIPRKGVVELLRLLDGSDNEVSVAITSNHIRVATTMFTFTSKLIEGRFPDYEKVLPKNGDKVISVPRDIFKHALSRASILSNEKLRGVRLQLRKNMLRILANNSEQEEAKEDISIDYGQADLDLGLNVKYLMDVFDTIDDDTVTLTLSNANSSILIEGGKSEGNSLFVIMPMHL